MSPLLERQRLAASFMAQAKPLVGQKAIILLARASGYSMASLGNIFGVSRERIRQIEKTCLRHVSNECLQILWELSEAVPFPDHIFKKGGQTRRGTIRRGVKKYPKLAFESYGKFMRRLGLESDASDDAITGLDALYKIAAEVHCQKIGDYFKCVTCKQFKLSSEFLPSAKSRLNPGRCKVCNVLQRQEYYWDNHEKCLEYARERNKLPEQREYARRWQQKHRKELLARARERRQADPEFREKDNAKQREYYYKRKAKDPNYLRKTYLKKVERRRKRDQNPG